MTLVARNLEAAMTRLGTNASEAARRAHLNPTAIYDILKGKSQNPRIDTLHKIAVEGIGVPLSVLLAEPGENDLDRELIEAFGMLSPEDRRRFLTMARSLRQQAEPTE